MDLKKKVLCMISGCSTKNQLDVAISYANLALKKAKSWEKVDWLVCFERYIAVVQFKLGIAPKSLYVVECKND